MIVYLTCGHASKSTGPRHGVVQELLASIGLVPRCLVGRWDKTEEKETLMDSVMVRVIR